MNASTLLGVDSNGQLWIANIETGSNVLNTAGYPAQDNETLSFKGVMLSDTCGDMSSNRCTPSGRHLPLLFASPRASSSSPTVTQVPTTGAPSSDLLAPAAIIGVAMFGVALVVRRRRV